MNSESSTPSQGPFPLAHLRAWHRAGHFPSAMPVVHIGAPRLAVRLAELFARPLPARPAVSDAPSAVPAKSAATNGIGNGLHGYISHANGASQQPAGHRQVAATIVAGNGAIHASQAGSTATLVVGSANGVATAGEAIARPSGVAAQDTASPAQPQPSTSPGLAIEEGVSLYQPQHIHPGEPVVADISPGQQKVDPPRAVTSSAAPETAADGAPAVGKHGLTGLGDAALKPKDAANAVSEAGVSAARAASRPQLRAVERMAVGKSKYGITVKAKVACRLFADIRGESNYDAVIVAPDGTEFPVKLASSKVRRTRIFAVSLGSAMGDPELSVCGNLSIVDVGQGIIALDMAMRQTPGVRVPMPLI